MARRQRIPQLPVEQAAHALHVLLDQGRIKTRDVFRALSHREKLIRELQHRLRELGAEGIAAGTTFGSRVASGLRAAEKASRPGRERARRAISATARRAYQQQGRYMAALRPLSRAARAKIKKIREKSGVNAAVAAAKRMAR